jgi:Ca2+-binding RTX toxin-like protein
MALVQGTNGSDDLYSGRNADAVYGYDGDDELYGNGGADTLYGGKDDDLLSGGKGGDTFVYSLGDGNDTITDYEENDKISFTTSGIAPQFNTKGNNVIITVGTGSKKGKITILNAAKNGTITTPITYLDANGDEHVYPNPYDISGKTVTVHEAYTGDTFDVADLGSDYSGIRVIDASEVPHEIELVGNKNANKITAGDSNDTLVGGKANDTLTGGGGDDTFVYSAGDGKDVITDYESGEVIKIKSGTVTGVGITGNDYIISVGSKGTITLKDARDKFVLVEDASGRSTWYPDNPEEYIAYTVDVGTVTLKRKYPTGEFDVNDFESGFAGKVFTIDASAVKRSLVITGNEQANYITGTTQKDTINGGDGADTISGGKGNDVLSGGDGADVFLYNNGDGNDKILDYADEDEIRITGDKVVNTTYKGNNVIFTLSNDKQLTIVDGVDKRISYSDSAGEHTYPDGPIDTVQYGNGGKSAVILSSYSDDEYSVPGNYKSTLITIDATQVGHDLSITGNGKGNVIYGTDEDDYIDGGKGKDYISGGAGNDTLWGNAGNDTLFGGDGKDVFYYGGEGNDVITDYNSIADIIIYKGGTKGDIDNVEAVGSDVIFTMANGNELTLKNASSKMAQIVNESGVALKTYRGSRS